ncbi:hypothetical protein LCGC14_0386590 [marine sediment metagenome]|uniref:Uncharacterized protein n=1 Tax=marine sediment metagenome TaxID=412755 RepID=A0A0F9T0Y0_9ZZZZ
MKQLKLKRIFPGLYRSEDEQWVVYSYKVEDDNGDEKVGATLWQARYEGWDRYTYLDPFYTKAAALAALQAIYRAMQEKLAESPIRGSAGVGHSVLMR